MRSRGVSKTALISLAVALLPWSALAKPSPANKARAPAHASLHGADKQLASPAKAGGLDIAADDLRAILHPAALVATTDPKAVAAGHNPMEIRLVKSPKRKLKTKLGRVKSVGPAFATKVKVDGTKGAIVLAGKLPEGFELKDGQRIVTIAVFDAPESEPKAQSGEPSIVGVFPSIVGKKATTGSGNEAMEPFLAFGRPLTAKDKAIFDFGKPLASLDAPVISMKTPKTASEDDLGFFAAKRIYLGPASVSEDGVLGLVAAKGTLTEVGFGVIE